MPAIELGGMTLGVREGVIVLITLVAIYMVFVLLRMRRLRSQPKPVALAPSPGLPVEEIPVLHDVEPPSTSAALREDMRQEVAHMHSAQAISPVYGDAMQMAAAGYDPVMIADRCGIARAEAELVVALAKSQMQ